LPPAPTDLISLVEEAYRTYDEPQHWLKKLLHACRPNLFDGLGGLACFYDRNAESVTGTLSQFVVLGCDERIAGAIRAGFESGSLEERDRSLRGGPVVRLSALARGRIRDTPVYGPLARELGFEDLVGLHAANPDGTGAFIGAPLRQKEAASTRWDQRWSRVCAHFAAGMRLQRLASTLAHEPSVDRAEAILDPAGKVHSTTPGAATSHRTLRRAVLAMDRARGRLRFRDPSAAVDAWTALVDGRWSLVDHFESDGKRFLLAMPNESPTRDPRALSPSERTVLHYVAMGHSNKLIAYELGLPYGTVATRVATLMRKMGVRSRVEIVDRYFTLRKATVSPLPSTSGDGDLMVCSTDVGRSAGSPLTASEDEVTAMAARGMTNHQIARARGCAPRTVANQLASAYRKLGITARRELPRAFKTK